jgi:hypothetical protein
VRVDGAGARVFLKQELDRFLRYLGENGQLVAQPDQAAGEPLVKAYLERYRAQIRRKVDRYRSRLRRTGDPGTRDSVDLS